MCLVCSNKCRVCQRRSQRMRFSSSERRNRYAYIIMHVLMRRKEGRKKQARSNKQQGKATQHTQGSQKNELPRVEHVHGNSFFLVAISACPGSGESACAVGERQSCTGGPVEPDSTRDHCTAREMCRSGGEL